MKIKASRRPQPHACPGSDLAAVAARQNLGPSHMTEMLHAALGGSVIVFKLTVRDWARRRAGQGKA